MEDENNWFVGVDWASQTHHVRLSDARGAKIGERAFEHGGEGLKEMADWILESTGAPPEAVMIAIEVPHGPVVESLMERGLRVHAINPKQLDRFRDRFSPAGAKDDSRDAEALADALRTDRRCFRLLAPLDPTVVELREWSRIADELRVERTRLSNQVRELLWRYYPQLLELCDDVAADWVLELWRLVPTPDKARRVREATVERLLKRHRIRRLTAAAALERLRAPAISVAAGTVSAVTGHIEGAAQRLALVNRQIREADKRLDRLTEKLAGGEDTAEGQTQEPRDVTILRSLPGVGRIVLATLLTEAQHALQRRDYHALRCLSGVAPITKRSGKSKIVLMRQAAHVRLRNAVYHWARTAVQHDPRSRAKYAALRARGHGHGRALRSVADRLLAVACAMLQTRTLFNPSLPEKIANPRP
ncbi:IS110 family transposase [Methylosinus sp. LW4]|uniref:IS110 family transposase n=1 Tax=Methylosinus sp. LW4 TaxID=136993 RepID=UPI00036F6F0F|nr:IS110 family transposase [Methylosinus sp. LW4]